MNLTTREMTIVALFPALMAATAFIAIPVGIGAPITLQTLFVMLAGVLLGSRLGAISILIYVVLGAIGLPIFAGFTGGFGVLFGPTGGFIFSFIIMAFIVGKMKNVNFINNDLANIFITLVIANLIVYMIGGAYLGYYLKLNLASTVAILVPYLFGDFIKIVIVSYVHLNIRSRVSYEGA